VKGRIEERIKEVDAALEEKTRIRKKAVLYAYVSLVDDRTLRDGY
jgi:hypothetical protein